MPDTRILGPFNRVEGDLEIHLDIEEGRIAAARVHAPLFRGFEQMLTGRDPRDALVIVPRVCGICSVSQSMAAAAALRQAMGLTLPPNGERATNLMLALENLADHLTHFYLFFMPDFARPAYARHPWHAAVAARFRAVAGQASADVLPARAAFLHGMGLLAGKWPHTLGLVPGGSTRALSASDALRLFTLLREFRRWLERHFFGDSLEAFAALDSPAALWRWASRPQVAAADLGRFLALADALALDRLGRANDRFLAFGGLPEAGVPHFPAGVWTPATGRTAFDSATIVEDLSHAWLQGDAGRHPRHGQTEAAPDKATAYSWCKAPRLAGQVHECGALARQLVAGQPLLRALVSAKGGSVLARVLARAFEFAQVLPAMEAWAQALQPGEPFCAHARLPEEADGEGLVEAARGALGHWLSIRQGRIARYQIVAPTTWNFSPRDLQGTPGPLEQALAGVAVGDDGPLALAVQHIVRAFDPCMACTVH